MFSSLQFLLISDYLENEQHYLGTQLPIKLNPEHQGPVVQRNFVTILALNNIGIIKSTGLN
jgi:hypothetical protein